jgi:hypothetical protein
MRIRTARSDDLAALVEIERATGRMFLMLDATFSRTTIRAQSRN